VLNEDFLQTYKPDATGFPIELDITFSHGGMETKLKLYKDVFNSTPSVFTLENENLFQVETLVFHRRKASIY
jgi:hypothetical protein